MIKRIKEIVSVGRFASLRASSIQFGRITLLYGENAFGKSTLADILSCLERADVESITRRPTIPSTSRAQVVSIGVALGEAKEGTKEAVIEYRNGAWHLPSPMDLRWAVFDDGFHSRNVFTGRVFERQNKEEFTSFVLGRQGVELAETIATKQAELVKARKRSSTLKDDAFHGTGDLGGFMALVPGASEEELRRRITTLEEGIVRLREEWRHASRRGARPVPVGCTVSSHPRAIYTQAFEILNSSLPDVLRSAREAVELHINRCFKESLGAEPWLREGLRQNRGLCCQMCGQELSDEAKGLFESYERYFNAEYRGLESKVREDLPRIIAGLSDALRLQDIAETLQGNEAIVAQYTDYEDVPEFRAALENLNKAREALKECVSGCQGAGRLLHDQLVGAHERKMRAPMEAIACPPCPDLSEAADSLIRQQRVYNAAVADLAHTIEKLRFESTPARIQATAEQCKKDLEQAKQELRRVNLSPQVDEYRRLSEQIPALGLEIEDLRKRLEQDQSQFLQSYFERLNMYFQEFGSHEFKLQRKVDNRGHKPVISIEVLFKGTVIPESRLEHVFSASDRRALSLSIFWAQLYGLSSELRAQTIVVLDDPVTSFDEHRISAHNDALVKAGREFRQVIVLTHFRDQVAQFMKSYASEAPRLLTLVRSGSSSEIAEGEVSAFTASSHERARQRCFDFVDARTNTIDVRSLRVFFEKELEMRFAEQLHRHGIKEINLSDRIDRMGSAGILAPSTVREAHDWRTRLNPDHHSWVETTIEDQRNTTRQLMAFVYEQLVAGKHD